MSYQISITPKSALPKSSNTQVNSSNQVSAFAAATNNEVNVCINIVLQEMASMSQNKRSLYDFIHILLDCNVRLDYAELNNKKLTTAMQAHISAINKYIFPRISNQENFEQIPYALLTKMIDIRETCITTEDIALFERKVFNFGADQTLNNMMRDGFMKSYNMRMRKE